MWRSVVAFGLIVWALGCSRAEDSPPRSRDDDWMAHWSVPADVGKALIAIGRCPTQPCTEPLAAGKSLIDLLIPTADRERLTLNRGVTDKGTVASRSSSSSTPVRVMSRGG